MWKAKKKIAFYLGFFAFGGILRYTFYLLIESKPLVKESQFFENYMQEELGANVVKLVNASLKDVKRESEQFLIISMPDSGSEILSEKFASQPGTFYFHEPLKIFRDINYKVTAKVPSYYRCNYFNKC